MPTNKSDLGELTKLGSKANPERKLEVFPNHASNLIVTANCTEFTCYCPLTKQPDFATLEIKYKPKDWIIESKSLKLYLESFRNEGVFHEHLADDIAKDILEHIAPEWVSVEVNFNVRGGIAISAKALL